MNDSLVRTYIKGHGGKREYHDDGERFGLVCFLVDDMRGSL